MNVCALSGVVAAGSLHLNEESWYVVFTLRTSNGMLIREEFDNEVSVPCVVLSPDECMIEKFKQCKPGDFIELQGRVQDWDAPARRKQRKKKSRHIAKVVVDAETLKFF